MEHELRIFVLPLSKSLVKDTDVLDEITNEENKIGVNKERYWLINTTNTTLINQNNLDVYKLNLLFRCCVLKNFTQLMILKNS